MNVVHKKEAFRRRYSILIDRRGSVIVKTGKLVTTRNVEEILSRHKLWIQRRLNEFEKRSLYINQVNDSQFYNGMSISILGTDYTIQINTNHSIKRVKISFDSNYITIITPKALLAEEIKSTLQQFLIKFCRLIFEEKVNYFANLYTFSYNRISIKSHKTKWGSCSTKKNLNFNWKLILFPEEVLEYVVIHEICHLKEMNHSERFWDLVKIHCKDYKKCRKILKETPILF